VEEDFWPAVKSPEDSLTRMVQMREREVRT